MYNPEKRMEEVAQRYPVICTMFVLFMDKMYAPLVTKFKAKKNEKDNDVVIKDVK